MPFAIPLLKDLANRTATGFRTNLKGSDAKLWPNNVAVSAKVVAGAVWEAFKFIEYISKQVLVHTATDAIWIERHATEYGLARLPASFAEGQILLTGDANVEVPAGGIVQRADGVQYEVVTSGTTDIAGEVTLRVRALTVGKIGNAQPGTIVTLTKPIDRIQTQGEVAPAGIGLGADTESDESLRQRVWFRKKMPPHGGAAHDYVIWAREVAGVTRVFVDPVTATNGRTSVGVYILMDDLYQNGIPQLADITAIAAYIDALRPAGAIVAAAAPLAYTVNLVIDNLSPDTTAIRNAIAVELTDLFRRLGVSTLTNPVTLYRSKIIEAVSLATGEDHHTLTTPNSDLAIPAGQVPVLGTVTYT